MQENNTYNVSSNLNKLDNMSEHEFRTKSMEICKTIIMDQKMIEDMCLTKRHKFEELNNKMLKEMEKGYDSNTIDKFTYSYCELIRQEARREYSQRLLKIILG